MGVPAGDPGAISIRAWRPPVPGIREVLHARFRDHAYPLHTHDVWTLFVVDEGRIAYDLERSSHSALPSMVSILPPHVVHDGRTAADGGYRKRVLYLETSLLGEHLIGPAVDRPVIPGAGLRARVSALHDALMDPTDALEAETRLHALVDEIRLALGEPVASSEAGPQDDLAGQFRALLDARPFEPLTLADAAQQLGARPTQLARAFMSTFGIPPHAYVLGRRLEAARERILDGQALADVAAEVGFADQAHLTRRFRRFLGTTPGRFAELASRDRRHP